MLIQTINPDHYAIQCAAAQDYQAFYEKELQFRRALSYPPFTALANVIVQGRNEEEALSRSAALGRLLQPAPEGVRVMGPAAASSPRASRMNIVFKMLLKAATRKRLNSDLLSDLRRFAAAEKVMERHRRW